MPLTSRRPLLEMAASTSSELSSLTSIPASRLMPARRVWPLPCCSSPTTRPSPMKRWMSPSIRLLLQWRRSLTQSSASNNLLIKYNEKITIPFKWDGYFFCHYFMYFVNRCDTLSTESDPEVRFSKIPQCPCVHSSGGHHLCPGT